MPRRSRAIQRAVLAGAAALVVILVVREAFRAGGPTNGDLAPAFAAAATNGQSVDLAAFRDRNPVLLNFFFNTCAPCAQEYPELKHLDEEYGPRGLRLISVGLGETMQSAPMFLNRVGGKFAVVPDPDREIARLYHVDHAPFNVLITREGRIAAINPPNLAKAVHELLGET